MYVWACALLRVLSRRIASTPERNLTLTSHIDRTRTAVCPTPEEDGDGLYAFTACCSEDGDVQCDSYDQAP